MALNIAIIASIFIILFAPFIWKFYHVCVQAALEEQYPEIDKTILLRVQKEMYKDMLNGTANLPQNYTTEEWEAQFRKKAERLTEQ